MTINCNYIDICYPDYLSDHYNRDNEQLLSAWVEEGMSTEDIVEGLMDCIQGSDLDIPTKYTDDEIEKAVHNEITERFSTSSGLKLFLEDDEDGIGEPGIYLYCYLTWSEDGTESN